MSQMEQALAETRERLSEKELETLERLANEVLKDESFAREFAMNAGATLEEYGLSASTVEGAVVEVVDPETAEPRMGCFILYIDLKKGILCVGYYVNAE